MRRLILRIMVFLLAVTGRLAAGSRTPVPKVVFIDQSFNHSCLRCLESALDILRRVAKENGRCNWHFHDIGDFRIVKDFLEDPRIRIHYDPAQEYSDEGPTIAYTQEGNKWDIYVQPIACRLSRWDLARALIHEFTHITLTPRAGQEDEAQLMEGHCGFRRRVVTKPITVKASPVPVPLLPVN